MALCDRGTIDSQAYWPGDLERFWRQVGSSREEELLRYAAVIHMRTPDVSLGYDRRIVEAWGGHPRRFYVESSLDFLAKVRRALELIVTELPPCCRLRLTQDSASAG